jgi:hypothetical protein
MKRQLFITLAIVGALSLAGQFFTTAAHPGIHDKNAFTPDTIQWGPPPPFIAHGAQLAVMEGNPGASTGDYTVRVKMPEGYRIAPHWHPLRENVTVISGTFKVGMPVALPTSTLICTTTRWPPAKSSSRFTASHRCSSTTSIPKTIRAKTRFSAR